MALKIFTIILVLFVAELTFLATKEPKKLKTSHKEILNADIEFIDLNGYTIDNSGIKNKIKAKKAQIFKTYNELYSLDVTIQDKNQTHNIKAKNAIYKNDKFTFSKDVFYKNDQLLEIKTQLLEYNTTSKIATTSKPFEMSKDDIRVLGESFFYDMANKRIKADKIHYTQEVNE